MQFPSYMYIEGALLLKFPNCDVLHYLSIFYLIYRQCIANFSNYMNEKESTFKGEIQIIFNSSSYF